VATGQQVHRVLDLDGMSYVDIAAALDASVAAVKSLLARARMGLAPA
jgi:DNA-directed RNA polymerase specialized sigma24 family protein